MKSSATALSALFNFLVRDGCGMAGTLLFTYASSSKFRTDVKRWRIFADVMVDLGITLECIATMFPRSFFLPMISLGNVCKAVCGVAAGASGGSINLHWAAGSDISDINAKFGAQHTVTGAIGLVFAGFFAQSVNQVSSTSLWVLYTTLTVLHIFANLQCMRLISFNYLNTTRMNMILQKYFASFPSPVDCPATLPTPREIAQHEPLWFGIPEIKRVFFSRSLLKQSVPISKVFFGVAFDDYCRLSGKPPDQLRCEVLQLQSSNPETAESSPTSRSTDGYLISSGFNPRRPKAGACVVVSFLADATPLQQAKAYFHANFLSKQLQSQIDQDHEQSHSATDLQTRLEVEAQTQIALDMAWEDFLAQSTEAGWDITRSELQTSGFEIHGAQ